jgi:hypothetical protein
MMVAVDVDKVGAVEFAFPLVPGCGRLHETTNKINKMEIGCFILG